MDERALVAEMRLVIQEEIEPLKAGLAEVRQMFAVHEASTVSHTEFALRIQETDQRLAELEKQAAADRARARIWAGIIGVMATGGGAVIPEILSYL